MKLDPISDPRDAGEFVKQKLMAKGMSQVQLTERAGIPNPTYLSQILSGRVSLAGSKYFRAISEVLGLTKSEIEALNPNIFVIEESHTPLHAHADAHPIETDLELIPVYGLAAAGPGVYNEDREAIGYMYVAREFARHPNRVTFMVEGESMAPTIEHGDAVHVDRSDTDLHNEKVFLVEVLGNGYVVKRAREYGPDDWELVSDNPKFKALRPTEARVMGRVFGVSPQMRKL